MSCYKRLWPWIRPRSPVLTDASGQAATYENIHRLAAVAVRPHTLRLRAQQAQAGIVGHLNEALKFDQ